MTAIDEIKSRIDIVDLVSQSVKLRRTGKNYSGFCPFHPNARTPAFAVFPESGTWRCFGQCNEGGDVFKFVMKKEGWDFATALRYLAEKAGVRLEPLTPERQEREEEHARLRTLLEDAVTYYRSQLTQSAAGKPAFEYLQKRGLTPTTIETFGLGYAPPGWETALNYFTSKEYTTTELVQAGLITERSEGGGFRDRFHNRILFPIRDAMGKMCGFGGRILDPNDIPKFINSPQTVLFDKGRLLYGLDQARKAIRAQEQAVIVEGYLDVIALHQAGFANTVSPMGTALTEDQLRLLKRFTRRMVLALDADAAGEKATLRGLELARQALDRSDEIGFDPRGLLRHEARLQADVRVTTLPAGKDPDEVALADAQQWAQIVTAAQPIVVHVMETLAASRNLEDPKEKREVANQVLPLIDDVPDPVERDAYRQRLARILKVDERVLVGSRQPPGRRSTLRRPGSKIETETTPQKEVRPAGAGQLALDMEKHCLRLVLQKPDMLYALDRRLQKASLGRFSADDFATADISALAALVLTALAQDQVDPPEYIHRNLSTSLADLHTELTQPSAGNQAPPRLLDDLLRTLIQLRLLRIREGVDQLRFLQQDAQQNPEFDLNMYNEMIMHYTQDRNKLELALSTVFLPERA